METLYAIVLTEEEFNNTQYALKLALGKARADGDAELEDKFYHALEATKNYGIVK